MTKNDLEITVAAGSVDQLWLYWDSATSAGWELWADSKGLSRSKGGDRLITARGEVRTFKTLDAGVSFIRETGYKGPLHIDGYDRAAT
jgi:hypothetical protein